MTKRNLTPFTLPIPGFGERKLTTEDFERTCEREGVTVERSRLRDGLRGFYYRLQDRPHINLDSRLKGTEKLFVEFHELAHYFLHTGQRSLFQHGIEAGEATYTPEQEWAELEATSAAVTALNPAFPIEDILRVCLPAVRRWGGRQSQREKRSVR